MTDFEAQPAPSPADAAPSYDRAVGVETVVVPERGQWAVDIVVFFADGVVRRRIATYRTQALAQISANCIRRGAERDIGGPING